MCNTKQFQDLIQKLQESTKQPQDSLEKAVAIESLAFGNDEVLSFFDNLFKHGCISGMVSSLVYYCDTEAFFDKHYEDIIWLKTEYEEAIGLPMQIPHQVKNHLAWFAFEQTAEKLFTEAGLEI